jgi:hypothetical protein
LVVKPQFTDEIEFVIINRLKGYAGQYQSIEVLIVNEIPLLSTGKRTPVISKVVTDFQEIKGSKIILR